MSEIRNYYRAECHCDFCSKIYDTEELENMYWLDRVISNCITYDKRCNEYCIWHECEDDFYSANILEIKYCPKCGRKLVTKD